MKFLTEDLLELLDADINETVTFDNVTLTLLENKLTSSSRWTLRYNLVFEHDGKFYKTRYSTGATECQDTFPFEDAGEEIECDEVFRKEKIIYVYD